MAKKAPNWESIADDCARRLMFAIYKLDVRGSGGVMNMRTGEMKSWREYLAEPLRRHPRVTLDEEVMSALDMIPAARRRRLKEITKQREAKAQKEEGK